MLWIWIWIKVYLANQKGNNLIQKIEKKSKTVNFDNVDINTEKNNTWNKKNEWFFKAWKIKDTNNLNNKNVTKIENKLWNKSDSVIIVSNTNIKKKLTLKLNRQQLKEIYKKWFINAKKILDNKSLNIVRKDYIYIWKRMSLSNEELKK